jgi:hypothetical protein
MIKKYGILLSFLNLFLFVCVLIVNFLATYLPLNGKSTGELSDLYPNLIVPAGITFSIWGIIYIFLAIFVIYNIIKAIKDSEFFTKTININLLFALTSILNICWIFAWHYLKITISLIIMILFLISLTFIFLLQKKLESKNRLSFFYKVPIEIYFGWITIATIVNTTAFLVHIGWNGFGLTPQLWTIIMILVGGIICIIMLNKYNAIAYSLVIIWAFTGIIIKRSSSKVVYNEIIITSFIIILFILINIIKNIYKHY